MGKIVTGAMFRKMVISGANYLENNKEYVDSLNVFPVPDGDTGTNMSMTMDAVEKVVDCLGGVEVLIEEDLTTVDERLVKGERVLLDGELAVKFLRARGGLEDSSNIARMGRQEAFMQALFKAADKSTVSEEALMECFDSVYPHIVTDLDANGLEWLSGLLISYDKNAPLTLPGEAKKGEKHVEFYVDGEGLMDIVTEYFFYSEE